MEDAARKMTLFSRKIDGCINDNAKPDQRVENMDKYD